MATRRRGSSKPRTEDLNGEWFVYDDAFCGRYPELAKILFGTTNEYGEEHQGGSLTIFERGGQCKFRLYDKTTGQPGWGHPIALDDIFGSVERQLVEGIVEWGEPNWEKKTRAER